MSNDKRDNIDEPSILALLDELFGRYRDERRNGERFGDFLWRVNVLKAGTQA